ncbi:malate synthase A [Actinoalloteichus sp. AHMU CJ021]|uniref:malate synthase A n=1 Tax=Actinoalloteichus sp. AHMU CJ021 TaxID=2072503 RepID=UPI000CA0794B|nr:malate synthase A [Actinoalloteichus sp. AHMU CJ021]
MTTATRHTPFPTAGRVEIHGPLRDRYDEILTPEALDFLALLDNTFAADRRALLDRRRHRRARLTDGTETPHFLPETAAIRDDPTWRVPPPPPGLLDRRVEITGPPDRRMTVNALNSGAKVWMADFEDATAPTWDNIIGGQLNLHDAIRRRIDFTTDTGRRYRIAEDPATIVPRPRGWHLVEKHLRIDGRPVSASLVDFGLHVFHNATRLIQDGSGPYLYLPKLENHREARLWNEVFLLAQRALGLPPGTIRATVLIETITAAFEMDEILHELRDHAAGLNAGRWDYLFSLIRTLGGRGADVVLPDRARLTMTVPFMRAYTELLVRTCHRRGAHAIGGMAAVIPSRDPDANREALAQVRQDKDREATDGFDGSWVAHPALVPVCGEAFTAVLGDRPHQLHRTRDDVHVTADQLLDLGGAGREVTREGVRSNVGVCLRYLDAWLRGSGAVAIHGLMEDAATAEIARAQLWQWIHTATTLTDGTTVTRDLVGDALRAERDVIRAENPEATRLDAAVDILTATALGPTMPDFLTPHAYAHHLTTHR